MDDLIAAMKAKRELLGLSQRKLAERLGISWSIVAGWERGERRPGRLSRLRIDRWLQDSDKPPLDPHAVVKGETLAQLARRVDRLERHVFKRQGEIANDAALPSMSGVGEPGGVSAPVGGEPLRQVHEDPARDGRGGDGPAAVRAPAEW